MKIQKYVFIYLFCILGACRADIIMLLVLNYQSLLGKLEEPLLSFSYLKSLML